MEGYIYITDHTERPQFKENRRWERDVLRWSARRVSDDNYRIDTGTQILYRPYDDEDKK